MVLSAMNAIRSSIGDEDVGDAIAAVLQVSNMTSVDDDPDAKVSQQTRVRHSGWAEYEQMQVEKDMPAPVIADQKALHEWIVGEFGEENLVISLTPTIISYCALSGGKRVKVFLYSHAQKRAGLKIHLPTRKGKPVVYSPEAQPDGRPGEPLQEELRQAYVKLKR